MVRGRELKPTDTWFPWRPPPITPEQEAASIRIEALAACTSQDWSGHEAKLDEAAEMDAEGEHEHHQRPKPGLERASKTITEGSHRVF